MSEQSAAAVAAETPPVPPVFVPRGTVPIKVGWPKIYPENRLVPFIFYLRLQLVADAEKIQKEFLMRPDAEQEGESLYQYDVEMLAQLSTSEPTGFVDFPRLEPNIDTPELLANRIRQYFLPEDPERREGFAFIIRAAMRRYWRVLEPVDYL